MNGVYRFGGLTFMGAGAGELLESYRRDFGMNCRHRWIEKNHKGQICTKCKAERGHFLPGARKPQWFKPAPIRPVDRNTKEKA
jgi:hypothetical protein